MGNLEIFRGATLSFMTPSLNTVTIREQTAEDDDILGKVSKGDLVNALNEFIAAIVVSSTYNTTQKDGALSIKDVLDLPLRDKHYILLKSRIHSIGPWLKFDYEFSEGGSYEFEEDLTIYDQDLESEDSYKVPEGKDKNCITRYPGVTKPEDYLNYFEIALSSNRKVRMSRMNGHSEKALLQANKNNALTVNTEYFVRNLQIHTGEDWVSLTSMNVLSKRDVIEIKKAVKDLDTQFTPITHVKDPQGDEEEYLPVLGIKDFFFPTEI